jgi:hypothetical protein
LAGGGCLRADIGQPMGAQLGLHRIGFEQKLRRRLEAFDGSPYTALDDVADAQFLDAALRTDRLVYANS